MVGTSCKPNPSLHNFMGDTTESCHMVRPWQNIKRLLKKLRMQYNNYHKFSEKAHAGVSQLVGALGLTTENGGKNKPYWPESSSADTGFCVFSICPAGSRDCALVPELDYFRYSFTVRQNAGPQIHCAAQAFLSFGTWLFLPCSSMTLHLLLQKIN